MENKITDLLKKYFTARIDIKNAGNKLNNVFITDINNKDACYYHPSWFEDNLGKGLVLECSSGSIDFEINCINSGTLKIWLRGIDCRGKFRNRFPIYIDYTNFEINDEKIFEKNILTWHDEPFYFEKKVNDLEKVKFHIEWLPFNNSSEYLDNLHDTKQRLENFTHQINSIPCLSCTSFGKSALDGKIIYRNWLANEFPQKTLLEDVNGFCEGIWFTIYLKNKFPNEDFKLNFFGPFEEHDNITQHMEGKKVFYSGEDLNLRFPEMKEKFDRYALDYVDLSLGFDFVDNPKYLRFPNWIRYHFDPCSTEEDIENIVDYWNSASFNKTKDVVNVSSHDWGVRALIADDIENIVNITYGGKWRNNTNELIEKYGDNKRNFIKQFKFNICAENLFDDAYVTEKIFDSIHSDCIPLYAGGGNYLEPEVLNPKAILRWFDDESHDNEDTVEIFKNLLSDEKTYAEFKDQDKVFESSKKYIINIFNDLEKHFERLIYE